MAKIGYSVVCASRDLKKCREAVENFPQSEKGDTNHLAVQCDMGDEKSVIDACRLITEQMKRVDVLVNAAGVNIDSLLIREKYKDIRYQIDINLIGPMLTCRGLVPLMLKQRRGAIINIGSVIASVGNQGQGVYGATKAGLFGFTRSIAKEVAPRGITANVLAPGFVETAMTSYLNDDMKAALVSRTPLGRFGTVEDMAHAVEFLSKATYMTGQVSPIVQSLH
jgi:NAD(P)-dependent dehydrogenase (short-subunit alcohol dehydrogenase family)